MLTLPVRLLLISLGLAAVTLPVTAAEPKSSQPAIEQPAPLGKPASSAYRQVLPDGRVVYSDRVLQGARVEEVIDTDTKGSVVVTEPPRRPQSIPPRTEKTPVQRVPVATEPQRAKTPEQATADVIRAEMLLEDARRQQKIGEEPLPGERTGNIDGRTSRLNEDYWARQQELARRVKEAEALLQQARAERERVLPTR